MPRNTSHLLLALLCLALCLAPAAARAQSAPAPPAVEQAAPAAHDSAPAADADSSKPAPEKNKTKKSPDKEPPRAINNTGVVPGDIQTKDDFARSLPEPRIESPVVSVGRVMLSLLLVIALIIATVYVLKYFYSRSMRMDFKGHHIRVLDTVQLGMNRAVYMVRVGDMIILLGTGDKGLVYLTDVSGAVDPDQLPEPGQGGSPFDFRRHLDKAADPVRAAQDKQAGSSPFNTRLKDNLKKLDDDSTPRA